MPRGSVSMWSWAPAHTPPETATQVSCSWLAPVAPRWLVGSDGCLSGHDQPGAPRGSSLTLRATVISALFLHSQTQLCKQAHVYTRAHILYTFIIMSAVNIMPDIFQIPLGWISWTYEIWQNTKFLAQLQPCTHTPTGTGKRTDIRTHTHRPTETMKYMKSSMNCQLEWWTLAVMNNCTSMHVKYILLGIYVMTALSVKTDWNVRFRLQCRGNFSASLQAYCQVHLLVSFVLLLGLHMRQHFSPSALQWLITCLLSSPPHFRL